MPADQQTDIFGGLHDLQTPTEQAQLFEFAPAAVDQLAGQVELAGTDELSTINARLDAALEDRVQAHRDAGAKTISAREYIARLAAVRALEDELLG